MKVLFPLVIIALSCSCPAKPVATSSTTPGSSSGSADPVNPATPPANPDPQAGSPSQQGTSQPGPAQGSTQPGPTQGSTQPGPTQGSGGGSAAEPSPSWSGGPGLGEGCGAKDRCAKGLTCVSYFGIAGPRGPEFKTCEIRCGDGGTCPTGMKCITIADGPGQVCRK